MSHNLYNLTNPQKSIWLTDQFYKGTSIENITGNVNILEQVDFNALKAAINLFVKKNDSFRLKFTVKDDIAMQYIDDFTEFDIERIEIQSDKDIFDIERKMSDIPFETLNNFLFNFKLFKFPDGHGGFVITAHHLISDAWTAGIVVNQVVEYYEAIIKNEKISEDLNLSYLEYINSEAEYINSDKFQKDKAFWNEMFETVPELATIPSLKQENSKGVNYCASKRKQFIIPKETINLINEFCKPKKASVFNFFMAVLSLYISRVSGFNEFVIGTPILNRGNFKEKNTTGMYISTIPFKVSINSDELFGDFLSNISMDFLKIFRHQKYPYQYLLEDLRAKDSSLPNLYNILMSYQNVRSNKQTSNILYDANWIGNNNISDDIDIHFSDMNDTGNIAMAYDYLISKYTIDDICSIHARILHIINQILQNSEIKLKDIEIVTPDEKQKILYDFNDTKADYPKDKTICKLFEEQVEKTPNNIAICFEDKKLTYKELNEKANSLAYYLRNNNIKRNDIVGIMVNRSLEMIISIIAVLKSGACYIPIDPEYPQDRIEYMLNNSNAKMLLTFEKLQNKVNFDNKLFIELSNNLYNLPKNNIENINRSEDLAYIIYTSGSTGKPKGVMLKHQSLSNLANYCNNYIKYLKDNIYRTIVSVTTVSFDIFIFETLISLQKGLKLVIANEDEQTIPRLLNDLIEKKNIEIIQTTPSRMQLLVNNIKDIPALSKLKFITLAGEQLPISLVNNLKEIGNPVIYNGYGPSETTIFSTLTDVTNHDIITIGTPLSNTQIYILNSDLNICPIDVPGEIYISGDGVGHGYINNKELTSKSYLSNKFSKDNKLLYKTGDLGSYLPNGEIMCLGRCDNQVKIRGLRIELEEIESEILKNKDINNCVVVKRTTENNHEFLCAYFTSVKNIDLNNIRDILQKSLPKYMIPQYFVKLDTLPYTPNGKIDRKKLPLPNLEIRSKEILPPRNNIDKFLINCLTEMLRTDNISIDDSFFELGGDSLAAINLCTKIYSEFNVQIFVKDILENPVIMNLSNLILSNKESNSHNINQKLVKADKKDYYPVSSAQRRIYYSTKMISENNLVYNVPGALLVDSLLDIEKIKNAFAKIIDLQPSFRTRFVSKDDELMQEVLDLKNIDITIFNDTEKNINKIINNFPKPFDLSKAPLLRASVCFLDNQKTLILLDTHHIIMDGVSLNILMRDFCKLYNDEKINKLDFDYIDYSVWENNYLNSNEIEKYDKYWSSVCSNTEVPALNLPYDYPVSDTKSYNGDKISYIMQNATFERLQKLSKSLNVSEYTVFLTALYVLLYKYTAQTDLIVASPLAGRNFDEISNVIGMFVNNIVLRENIDINSSISDLLKDVQNTVSSAISNQPYPYELVAKKLNNNTSLLDVVLTYQNTKKDEYKIGNSKLELIPANTKTSKFNIWLEIIPGTFTFNLEYNSDLFKKQTIQSFLNHYIFILEQIIDNVSTKIDDLEIITNDELKMLEKFNNTDGPINDDTVTSIFEEQVKKHPDDIAIICDDKTLTYDELNKKANSLAHYLIQKGIGANDIVCIMTNRSFETIVCMMAILKAGAAFFNVDPTYPIERTKYYLEDSKTKYILTQKELRPNAEGIENCIEIDLKIDEIYSKNFDNPNVKIGMQDLSYLIYTSGSTGKPKGVMLNQIGLANMVKAMTLVLDYLKEGNKHCIASVTSTPFDIFVYEIIVSLTHGLKIAMANNAEHRNPKLLDSLIRKHNVDVMTVTPSLMKINYDNREPDTALAMVKNMVFGGEPLPEKFVKDLKALADDITIYNIYGPSEITVLSNVQNLDGETEITTGPPIMNTQIHILDKNMKRVPIGVVGEIYISGIQVGLGYMGKPDLTKEKFLDNPFGEGKMYKSGDIGRWTFDGKVECLGRIDHQIKLRGLRIELGEIENIMLNIDGVSSAVVNKIEIDNKEFLCGYYVCDTDVKEEYVKNTLRTALPPYMVPTYIVKLQEMPYTINRKIDRKALPLPELNKPAVNSKVNIEELNSNEEKLLQIWKNILKIEDIDINDNFFDIGGDSVAAISMQIEAVKYGLDFEYSDIFTHPTIKELSKKSNRSDEEFIKTFNYKKFADILSRNNINNIKTIKKAKVKNILLIGSTGYFGAHVLDAFMKNHRGTVYCLVRPKNNIDIEQRLKDNLKFYFGDKYTNKFSKKIKVVHGDIIENNLGLSDKDYNMLCDKVDVVINSGALVKHFGIKKKFEEINVTGTQNIIDFCTKNNKRLLHISTVSISGNGEKEETVVETPENINKKKIFKETDIYVGQNIKGVYSTTKFRAELLILEAISNGLDAQILRLGNITNRYSDGVFQMNADENAFAKRIKSFIEIGAFPRYLLPHSIELTPVDLAAEAVIKILNHKSMCNVFHIYDTKLLPIKLLIETLNNDLNIDILAVPETMMKDILTGILADNNRKGILSGIIYDLDDDKNLIYTSNIRLNSNFTEKYLNKIGFKWKVIDKEYIIRYMNYLKQIKFINGGNK